MEIIIINMNRFLLTKTNGKNPFRFFPHEDISVEMSLGDLIKLLSDKFNPISEFENQKFGMNNSLSLRTEKDQESGEDLIFLVISHENEKFNQEIKLDEYYVWYNSPDAVKQMNENIELTFVSKTHDRRYVYWR